MTPLKTVTLWVRAPEGSSLPEAGARLEGLLQAFYQAFPEYDRQLVFSQSPRPPRHVFVYAARDCSGLLPAAGDFLRRLLGQAFPGGEVRPYGKAWTEK